jgi:hypothetical protein
MLRERLRVRTHKDRDILEAETASTVHARAAYAALGRLLRMKRGESRFRSRLLAVRADILSPFVFLFVLFTATLPGYSDSTTRQLDTPPTRPVLDSAGALAID